MMKKVFVIEWPDECGNMLNIHKLRHHLTTNDHLSPGIEIKITDITLPLEKMDETMNKSSGA